MNNTYLVSSFGENADSNWLTTADGKEINITTHQAQKLWEIWVMTRKPTKKTHKGETVYKYANPMEFIL